MQTTTNYGLKIYEGTDLFNPLTVENVNTSDLDTIVKGVSNAAVGTATELLTGTVHALTRSDTARNVFHFTATANYEAGETFEVDGVQVTAKTPDGQNLSTGAYVINSSVLCILDGTLLTVIVNPAKALDADKLDGHDSTYFATAGDLSTLDNQVGAISTKVGTGVLDVGSNCVDGINTLNTHLSDIGNIDQLAYTNSSGSIILAHNLSDYRSIIITCEYGGIATTQNYPIEVFTRDTSTRWAISNFGVSATYNSNLSITATYIDDTHINITLYSSGLNCYIYGVK